jgi:hypothetical protein
VDIVSFSIELSVSSKLDPLLIIVMLRTVRANQVIAVFHAVLGPGDELLPPNALQAADPNGTEESVRDFILGSSTPKT